MNETNMENDTMPSPLKKSFSAELLKKRQKKKPTLLVVVVIVALIAVGYALYMRYGTKYIPTEEVKSIAVLPFTDMTPDKNQEWFCDVISEGIIHALARAGELDVTARTSAFAFKGKDISIPEIGRQLNVKAVLEGSIFKSGNRLLITAQLIKVSDGFHIWSEEYDSENKNVFDLRDEISMAIVEKLKGSVSKDDEASIKKRPTDNPIAYSLYQQGLNSSGQQAVNFFLQAAELDPDFALAYAMITFNSGNYFQPRYTYTVAKQASEKAMELDDTLPESHAAAGFFQLIFERNLEEAEQHFKKAIQLNPDLKIAHEYYRYLLLAQGRLEEALKEIRRTRELDPLNADVYGDVMEILIYMGRYDEALEQYHTGIGINPEFTKLHVFLGMLNNAKGNYENTVDILEGVKTYGPIGFALAKLGYAYAAWGKRDEAMKILEDHIARYGEDTAFAHGVATIYMGLGDYEKAFEWLEKSYQNYDYDLMKLRIDPVFRPLRTDPRFRPLVEKILNSKIEPAYGPMEIRFAIVDKLYEKSKLVSVDPDIFDAYVGKYKYDEDSYITINKIGDRLMIQWPSGYLSTIRIWWELLPLSETSFCLKNFDYTYSFDRNERGQVTEFSWAWEMTPGSKNTRPKVSSEVPAIPERTEIDFDPAFFHDYAGFYQFPNGIIATVSMENDRLMFNWGSLMEEELRPLSKTTFFLKLAGPQVTFLRNAQGEVSRIVLAMDGLTETAEKIEF